MQEQTSRASPVNFCKFLYREVKFPSFLLEKGSFGSTIIQVPSICNNFQQTHAETECIATVSSHTLSVPTDTAQKGCTAQDSAESGQVLGLPRGDSKELCALSWQSSLCWGYREKSSLGEREYNEGLKMRKPLTSLQNPNSMPRLKSIQFSLLTKQKQT